MDGTEPWMIDPEAAWWAKLRRAEQHRMSLGDLVREFRQSDPYTLEREVSSPDRVAYRLHVHSEAPADISTAVGDVLHNLRSALDSLAYALAEQCLDRSMTPAEEAATEFPICRDPEAFQRFFASRRERDAMYSERARKAMTAAQPFYWVAMASGVDESVQQERYQQEYEWSHATRLRRMHNIDKHRRLNLLAFWPDLIYFGSDEGDATRLQWSGVFADGEVLCYLIGPKAHEVILQHEFALLLADDPRHRPGEGPYTPRDCLDLLQSCAHSVEQMLHVTLTEWARLA